MPIKRRRADQQASEFDGKSGRYSGGSPTTPSEEHREMMREGRRTQDGPRED